MVCIYGRILLRHKKEVVSFVATWMDLEIIIRSEEQDSTRFLKGKYRPVGKHFLRTVGGAVSEA